MPAAIDATGQRYGRLTGLVPLTVAGKKLWRFACDCGAEYVSPLGHVRSGKARSCGCLRREATAQAKTKDLSGAVIGRLTVLAPAPRRSDGRLCWICECACGKTKILGSDVLGRAKPTSSCGCLQREGATARGKDSKQDNPVSRTAEYRAAMRRKRRENPEQAMAERMSRMLCWALANVNAVKSGATFDALGYSPADLKTHLEKQFCDGMSWANRSEWEIDHITPISSARTPEDVVALNQLWNLRPLWAGLNNVKKNRREFLI